MRRRTLFMTLLVLSACEEEPPKEDVTGIDDQGDEFSPGDDHAEYTPPDPAVDGFLVLMTDNLAVAWTPDRGGAAWGGADGDVGWPNPFGPWDLTEAAPRAAYVSNQTSACVASANDVSCRGQVDEQWPSGWPRSGVPG